MGPKKISHPGSQIELLQELFDSIPDAVYFKDARGKLVMVNKAHASGLGLTPKDVIGKTDFDFFPKKEARRMTQDDRQVMAGGVSLLDVFERTTRPDGSQHCVSTTKIPRRNAKGKVVGIMGVTRDITERTRLEEDRYRMLFETSQNCIFITEKSGRWIDINDAGVKLFGYANKEELLKTNVSEIYANSRDRKIYTGVIEKENLVKDYELDLLKKNGSVIHALVTAVARKDKDGKVIGYQGTILDVTDKKKAEAEKEKALHELRGRIKELDCLYRIEEIRQREYPSVAQTLMEIASLIPSSWQSPKDTCCRIVYQKALYQTENFLRTRWFQKADIIANGDKVGAIEVCRLKKKPQGFNRAFSEEEGKLLDAIAQRLGLFIERRLMDTALDGLVKELADIKFSLDTSSIVAMTDQKGKITYVNDKFCEISKYARHELIGQDHRIVNSGYHSKEFMRNLWRTIAGGQVWKGEIRNRAKDGSIYWVDTTIVPFLDKKRKPYQYVAIRTEITQRKQMEEAVKALPQKIIQVQESERARISREIHDDLGQSLAILKMIIQSAMSADQGGRDSFDKSRRKIIKHLDMIIEKSRHLASDLRPAALEILGLATALEGLINDFRQTKDLHIYFYHSSLDRLVFQKEVINLYRIVQEALNNIVTHAGATQAHIVMRRRKNRLWVAIKDDGRGFDLDKFKEGSKAKKGIGLLTMEERVKLLGGEIKIQSQPAKGTMIIFEVPVEIKEEAVS